MTTESGTATATNTMPTDLFFDPHHFPTNLREYVDAQDPPRGATQETHFQLHPIDQEVLDTTGDLPDLNLLINPERLRRLRTPPCHLDTIETTGRNSTEGAERPDARNIEIDLSSSAPRADYTFRGYLLKTRRDAYSRALEIYSHLDGNLGGKFSSRLMSCRKFAWFVQNSATKKLRVMSSRCKLRWCPICRDVSRRIVTRAVDEWLKVQDYPKMITLTLMHSDDPLQLQIKRLYDSFRKLRRRAYFQRLVTGGVWFFQLKYNQKTEQWHPHIHCLVAGKFLPHARLKALWHEITGDSYVIDVRPVRDLDNASTEVARYATSPADITGVDLHRALDIFYATKGRRICGSWGSAKKVTMKPTVQDDGDEWIKVADFYFVNVQKDFDPKAKAFWRCYKRDLPYDGPIIQDERDVFAEELDIALSVLDLPTTAAQWHMRIEENRKRPWTQFFNGDLPS